MAHKPRDTQYALRDTSHAIRNTQDARRVNYAKQTQFSLIPNEHNLLFDKLLRQFLSPRTPQKQSQNKPNQTQTNPISPPFLAQKLASNMAKPREAYAVVCAFYAFFRFFKFLFPKTALFSKFIHKK